jgi:hypothetical protein
MLERVCSALVRLEAGGELWSCSRLLLLDLRWGGGLGGWNIDPALLDVDDIADIDRWRNGGGGGDLRLDVRLSPTPKPSSAVGGLG